MLFIFDPSQSEEEISPLPLKMFVQFYAQQLIFRDLWWKDFTEGKLCCVKLWRERSCPGIEVELRTTEDREQETLLHIKYPTRLESRSRVKRIINVKPAL